MIDARGHDAAVNLNMLGAFAEVWLAKQSVHKNVNKFGPVGMNLLTKLEPPTLSALYGAMLAGVDCIIMGAGIPRDIPKAIDNLAKGELATIDFHVTGAEKSYNLEFNPANYSSLRDIPIITPAFLAIISSHVLAKRAAGSDYPPNGFVIEGPTAGGHNAPPRSKELDEHDQPFYGPKDEVNLEEMRKLNLPFWLAGSYGNPEGLKRALSEGAKGIQVGSAFALCKESGLASEERLNLIDKVNNGGIDVKTDFRASPTGFPFKVPAIEGSLSEDGVYEARERICDLGYLREAYADKDSKGLEIIGYRCASEPIDDYLKKGGELAATIGRKCLCNGLMSAVNLGQLRGDGEQEPAIFTIGDNVNDAARRIVSMYGRKFSAKDVIGYLHGNTSNRVLNYSRRLWRYFVGYDEA